jgi:hypothetical protein
MRFFKSFLIVCFALFAGLVSAETTLVITHPAVSAPTYLDLGQPGQSVGDIRIFHFTAMSSDGSTVTTDWILTTTSVDVKTKTENRITTAVFSFGDGTQNQINIQGVAQYPTVEATLEESQSAKRSVVGGTGRFADDIGWMETTHLKDGTWQHVLHLKKP